MQSELMVTHFSVNQGLLGEECSAKKKHYSAGLMRAQSYY